MKPAAGHDKAAVPEFTGHLVTGPMHVAQTHAEFLAADAKSVTGSGMLCH